LSRVTATDYREWPCRGRVEGIGVAPHLTVRDARNDVIADRNWPAEGFDQAAATREVLNIGASLITGTPVAPIGFRRQGTETGQQDDELCASPGFVALNSQQHLPDLIDRTI
jgi:hypothetical protein